MSDLSPASLFVAILCIAGGLALGWWTRGRRSKVEKEAITTGWQAQLEATGKEHERLADQNTSLMEQVSQLQTSSRDASNRARELSKALQEALAHRDTLQREIKVIRNSLETVVGEKHRLNDDLSQHRAGEASVKAALAGKDARIQRLKTELRNWQDRLPPLIARFRERDNEASRLEKELRIAAEHIRGLEDVLGTDDTRVEPMTAADLLDRADASNELIDPAEGTEDVSTPAVESNEQRGFQDSSAGDDIAGTNGFEYAGGLRDNLREIKGIGPAIEKTLNELGIFRFAQVAAMTRYDIGRIANRLKGFQGRIEREDWIGQATMLAENSGEEAADPVDVRAT
jgi:predicted flap endonuclease-1-like 5' DNA nuclease